MKIILLTSLIATILVVKSSLQHPSNTVKVSLYYETLCPDCMAFIKEQLYPSYSKIGSSLFLDFTPYGNVKRSRENGSWVFNCQHGPDECNINKLEACGLARNNNQDEQMEFVYCVQSYATNYSNDLEKLAQCASKLGLTGTDLLECSQGDEGNQLLARLAVKQEALSPSVNHVPWLIFNDEVHNSTLESKATEAFLKTVCDLLSEKPDGCTEFNNVPKK